MDSRCLHSQEGWLEESLRGPEPLVSDGDDLSVWELVALLERAGAGSGLHLLLEVEGNVAQLLLDVPDDFSLGGGGEGVSPLGQDLGEVVGKITSGEVKTDDGVGKCVS